MQCKELKLLRIGSSSQSMCMMYFESISYNNIILLHYILALLPVVVLYSNMHAILPMYWHFDDLYIS